MIGSHLLFEEPFCRTNVALRAEHVFDGLPIFVHRAVQIFTRFPDLDLDLINTI